MSVSIIAVLNAVVSPVSVRSVAFVMLFDWCCDAECCVACTGTCTFFLCVSMAAGIVVARTILFFIIVVY